MLGKVWVEGKSIAIRFDGSGKPSEDALSIVRSLSARKYDPPTKLWYAPLRISDEVDRLLRPQFEIDPTVEKFITKRQKIIVTDAEIDRAFSTASRPPFKHQVEAVRFFFAGSNCGILLADDMGLGKTYAALVIGKILKDRLGATIRVIAPVSLKENWKREATLAGVDIVPPVSWAKPNFESEDPFVLIADEAHYAQSLKAKRTKAMLELAWHPQCVGLILLTGTPMKNGRPTNLYPLLKALKHPLSYNKTMYEKRYCAAGPTRFSRWDTSGATNLKELHVKTKDVVLRRTKAECLDLPGKIRVMRTAELEGETAITYYKVLAKLKDEYKKRVAKGLVLSTSEALVMTGHLRFAASMAKVATAVDLAKEVLEQGDQVVLFVCYKTPGYKISQELNCEFMSGDTKQIDRQPMIDRFQNGEKKALVCTYGTGGVGINLVAGSTVILVDRSWTPGDVDQAESRLDRQGQKKCVTSIWLQVDTDSNVDTILATKVKHISEFLDDSLKTGNLTKMVLTTILGSNVKK